MSPDAPIVRLEHVSSTVVLPNGENLTTVDDVSLELEAGVSYAVVGRSGSGKTSLISIVGLLNHRYTGSYFIDGREAHDLSDADRARLRCSRIGFVFQNYSLIKHISVQENVELPLRHIGRVSRQERRRKVMERLDQVGLAARAGDLPARLSGGEQQRVAIARALVADPGLMICDEPTGALDRETGDQVMAMLLDLVTRSGATLLLVTHDQEIAARCERRLVMDRGRLEPCSR